MSLPEDPNDPLRSTPPEETPPAQPAEEGGEFTASPQLESNFEAPPMSAPAALPAMARRKRRSQVVAAGSPEFLSELAHQGTPSFDFFLFSLLAGAVIVAAILSGAPALYLLAALLAPFMAPLVGISLSATAGSPGFFLRSVASLMIGALMAGVVGGLGGILWGQGGLPPQAYAEALSHALFSWPDLIVLLLGTAITLYLVGRSPRSRPLVSSVALAYEIYLPLSVAGFGLAAGLPDALWQGGLLVFAAHVALAGAAGALVLLLMGLHPARAANWLAAVILFCGMAAGAGLILSSGLDWASAAATLATPEALLPTQPIATPSPLAVTATLPLPTSEPIPSDTPEPSRTPTSTIVPTPTASQTLAPSPTPVWGLINAGEYKGAIIRSAPGATDIVAAPLNGAVVQILPEVVNKGGILWLHVRTPDGKEGWVQSSLILTATPVP